MLIGECYYSNGDYKKIYQLFQQSELLHNNHNFLLLAAKGLLQNKQYSLCQEIFQENEELGNCNMNPKVRARMYILSAKCHEA